MDNFYSRLVLLLICILSRLLSSINYLEDAGSLESALAVLNDYSQQSVFSFDLLFQVISKGLYFVFRDLAIVYSILGGISLYFIILFTLRLINVPLLSLEGFLVGLLLFFNPMIWIASNQYVADLPGAAVAIASFYYLVPDTYKKKDVYIGSFLFGILGGLKAFYIPFLIIPFIYALSTKQNSWKSILCFVAGVALWVLPSLILLGGQGVYSQLLTVWDNYSYDLKLTWSEFGLGELMAGLFQGVWADGLGGFWKDRSISLLITSVGTVACLFFGFIILLNFDKKKEKIGVLLASILVFSIWIMLFGDLTHQSNPVLLIIPFLMILIAYGIIYFLVNFNFIFVKVFALLFILGNVFLTVVLVVQHTYPSAVAQAKEHILTRKSSSEKVTIVAPQKLSDFLASQNIKANFVPASEDSIFSTAYKLRRTSDRIIIIGFSTPIKDRNIIHFSHNPYVNRKWPRIFLYEYSSR